MTRVALRVVHISDTHLCADHRDGRAARAAAGWRSVLRELQRDPPDLVVHSGDLVLDDPDDPHDRQYAYQLLHEFPVTTLAVPGNHDVGDHPHRPGLPADWNGPPFTEQRRAAWCRTWGADRWAYERQAWRLLGLNSQVLGSGLPAEDEQWDWLAAELSRPPQPTLVILHEPLYLNHPDETADSWVTPPQAARRRLLRSLAGAGVAAVLSGHIHRYRQARVGETMHISAPSSAYPIPPRPGMPHPAGDRRPGLLRHDLHESGTTATYHIPFAAPERHDQTEGSQHAAFASTPPWCGQRPSPGPDPTAVAGDRHDR